MNTQDLLQAVRVVSLQVSHGPGQPVIIRVQLADGSIRQIYSALSSESAVHVIMAGRFQDGRVL